MFEFIPKYLADTLVGLSLTGLSMMGNPDKLSDKTGDLPLSDAALETVTPSLAAPPTLKNPIIIALPTPSPRKQPVVAAAIAVKSTPRPALAAPAEIEVHFQKYAGEFNLDVEKLKRIANCESHFHPDSVSPSGAYGGMFQFSASTWASTRKAMGLDPHPDLRFNAEEAIRTAAFKISHGGIGAWPVCGKR